MSLRLSPWTRDAEKRLFTPKDQSTHTHDEHRHMCTVPMHTSEHVHASAVCTHASEHVHDVHSVCTQ